ncbi:MAG TPA: hypothetical protein VNO24_07960 [Blastocatellia bacterium]|nr:hypothetical protein [Blastocatellia bacterium]
MSIKMKAQFETEVYLSKGGYLTLKQSDPLGGDDTIVCLTHDQVKLLAKEFQKWAKNGDWWCAIDRAEDDC